jgi:hypothetical protein
MRRRPRAAPLAGVLAALICASAAFAQAADLPVDFRSLLGDAGVAESDLAAFQQWDGTFTEEQGRLAGKLLYRLQSLERLFEHPGSPTKPAPDKPVSTVAPGQLAAVDGVAISSSRIPLPASSAAAIGVADLALTLVSLQSGERVAVLSTDVPADWKERGARLSEPIEFVGVLMGSNEVAGKRLPLILANRLKWRPTANVPAGTAWLVKHGFDAALLDEVRHGQPFAKIAESREAQAFYDVLSIMARTHGRALRATIERSLPDHAKAAEAEAAEAGRVLDALTTKWESADQTDRARLKSQLQAARRRQAIAAGVASQGERGLSSVVPLFLDPEHNTGEAVLLEGTARRAVRIVVEDDAGSSPSGTAKADAQSPIEAYYELDLFTKDSQHLPIICCVPRLPEGFPTGEVIREPMRVSGVFFKKWAYARRTTDEPATRSRRLPARLQSPLIIAAAPEWLPSAPPTADKFRGLLGGIGFVATILIIWIFAAGASRGDRIARWRRARYDSRLEKIADP